MGSGRDRQPAVRKARRRPRSSSGSEASESSSSSSPAPARRRGQKSRRKAASSSEASERSRSARRREKKKKQRKREKMARRAMLALQQQWMACAMMQQQQLRCMQAARHLPRQRKGGGSSSSSSSPSAPRQPATQAAVQAAAAPQAERRRKRGWDPEPAAPKEPVVPAVAAASSAAAPAQQAAKPRPPPVALNPPPEKLAGDAWEEPRSATGLRLLGEASPVSASWMYLLHDESRRSFAGYLRCPLGKDFCESAFSTILDGAAWRQPQGANGPMPRKTAWMVAAGCNCVYRYGGVAVEPEAFPPWMLQLMRAVMPLCALPEPSEWPDSCNLNLYEDGKMSVGWHADDEQLFQGRFRDCRIISLSLGASRSFELRANWPGENEAAVTRLALGDGDLCTMEGMVQKHFQHRVPREDSVQGRRINLTWRWILKHGPRCPAGRSRPF